VLFAVERDFYEALRAQELLLVQEAQTARAKMILEQTELRVEVGDSAPKDILQARADYLNAEVSKLTSVSRTYTTKATLKASVGWDEKVQLPALAPVEKSWDTTELPPLSDVIAKGLVKRPDLASQRKQVEGSRFNVRLAELDAGVQMSLDVTANRAFGDDVSNRGQLLFEATIPLFDGRRSREAVRARRATQVAAEARYVQSERNARSEIESAYTELEQARQRMAVADAAYLAAKTNFDAAIEAQRLGAGTLLDVLTAQVSLVTAESNRVETFFDLRIADSRLKLVTGQPLRGE
jgi:outer membrane protein